MAKSAFINGLLKQDLDSAAVQIAMMEDLRIWKIAQKKLSGLISNDDELSLMIEDRRKALLSQYRRKPKTLSVRLLATVCDHLGIERNSIDTVAELDDIGTQIEQEAIIIQRRLSKGEYDGTTIESLIKYNLQKMFADLTKKFSQKSEGDQERIIENILHVLEEMPNDQKEKLREELGIDEISGKTIAKAITSGALGIAFVSVIEVAGFSAYIFATKALAAIAGIVGLTLPFAVYTGLTSMIAFLSNPFIAVPGILILGTFLTKRANRKIRNALIPVIVTQSSVAASKEGEVFNDAKSVAKKLGRYV